MTEWEKIIANVGNDEQRARRGFYNNEMFLEEIKHLLSVSNTNFQPYINYLVEATS